MREDNKMGKESNTLVFNFRNQEDVKKFLLDIGLGIDDEGYIINENKSYIEDSRNEPIHYKEVDSIVPGSKVVIKRNDFSAVSNYFQKYLIDS